MHIDKIKKIIKLFENSTRKDIGISLLAYEEYISKGIKITDDDLDKLSSVFDYYDKYYSDDYPNLINDPLQNINDLICECYGNFDKDGYNFKINYEKRELDETTLGVIVRESHSRIFITELQYKVSDKNINSIYDENPFLTTIKACKEVKNKILNTNVEDILKSYKL